MRANTVGLVFRELCVLGRDAECSLPLEDTTVSWTHTRSRIAHIKKADPSADVSELRRQLKAERLEDHIKRTVEAAPQLTPAQREKLATLLRGGHVA